MTVAMLSAGDLAPASNGTAAASCKCVRGWSGPACLKSNGTKAGAAPKAKAKGKKAGAGLAASAGGAGGAAAEATDADAAASDEDTATPVAAAAAVTASVGAAAGLSIKSLAANAVRFGCHTRPVVSVRPF
jgi:hypothetical protein